MMNEPSPTLILAVPGTQETQELPREAVLAAIQRGEIAPDHWVWSPAHNDWKQVAELPELQVPPPVAPTFMNGAVPAAITDFPSPARQVTSPKVQKAHVPALSETQQLARTHYSQPMEIKHEFPIFKVLFFVLFLLVTGIIAANYFMVDQPFATNLGATPFASVPAYAHLGAFTQPGALVIHVPPTKNITPDNFADFLVALAKSTPPEPYYQIPFSCVGLTSSWKSQYIFDSADWQKLAQMDSASSDEKKEFELEHMEQLTGAPLVIIRRNEDPAAAAEIKAKAWQSLVTNFQSKSP